MDLVCPFGSRRKTPGFNPETVFAEIGALDFDGALYLASNFSDKSLRGMTSLALAEQCLKESAKPKPKDRQAGNEAAVVAQRLAKGLMKYHLDWIR